MMRRLGLEDKPLVVTEEVPCGLCGSDRSSFFSESYDFEYETCRNRWVFVRCENCGNVYLRRRPEGSQLGIIYPPSYHAFNYDRILNEFARTVKHLIDQRKFRFLCRTAGLPVKRYLDVGCGDGRYLRLMSGRGLPESELYGLEQNEEMVRMLTAEGFKVFSNDITDAESFPPASFQLITMFSVFEHLSRPREALEKILSLLSDGGLAVIEVPDIDSLDARIFKERYWGGYHAPRHFSLFGFETIRKAALETGFASVTRRNVIGPAIWLWSLHNFFRYGLGWERLGTWCDPRRCVVGMGLFTLVESVRSILRFHTDNMMILLQKRK